MQSSNIKEWNLLIVTDYTQITQRKHSKGGVDILMSKFKTPKHIIKCAQNIGYICSMCEQSYLQSLNIKDKNNWSYRLHKPDTPIISEAQQP